MTLYSPMSMMSQPQFTDFGVQQPPKADRTSILAVTSLVLGLLSLPCCFIPVVGPALGLVGIVFAIASMIFISSAQGRLGGRGLAIGGLVCSILGTLGGIFVLVGVSQAMGTLGNYGKFVQIAQGEDRSELEEMLTEEAAGEASKEGMDAFRHKVEAELGAFKRVTPGVLPLFKNFGEFGKIPPTAIPARYQPGIGQTMLPLPGEFEKGNATVIVFVASMDKTPALQFGRVQNLAVVLPDGSFAWFIDPDADTKDAKPVPPSEPPSVPGTTAPTGEKSPG